MKRRSNLSFAAATFMAAVNLIGARASVIGLGKSGLAVCQLLKTKGVSIFASDNSGYLDKEILNELKSLDIEFEVGRHTEKCLGGRDFIVVSPGVPLNSFPLDEARKRDISIYSEIEVGFWFVDAPIVAITGTNGKTTTVTLVGEMLKAMGKKVIVCGNIGRPLCRIVTENKQSDVIVMEASSFQLEAIRDFKPHVSVLLNITPNHLNRYSGNLLEYIQAKANIFKNQSSSDFAILNSDDENVRGASIPAHVKKIYFSIDGDSDGSQLKLQNGSLISYLHGKGEKLLSSGELRLPGRHNISNVLAACGIMLSLFPEERSWIEELKQFRGLPHRLEKIREVKGVCFINDSKGTSVDACLKAMQSIPAPIILIAGGRDKDSPYEVLREMIASKVKRLILIGESKDKMAGILRGTTAIFKVASLKEAVLLAFKHALPGDFILLSPACSSFDMFRDFEERGERFKEIVMSLQSNGRNQS